MYIANYKQEMKEGRKRGRKGLSHLEGRKHGGVDGWMDGRKDL